MNRQPAGELSKVRGGDGIEGIVSREAWLFERREEGGQAWIHINGSLYEGDERILVTMYGQICQLIEKVVKGRNETYESPLDAFDSHSLGPS